MFKQRHKKLMAAPPDIVLLADFGGVTLEKPGGDLVVVKMHLEDGRILQVTMGEYYNMMESGNSVLGLSVYEGAAMRNATFYGMRP
jgi:hypothetical protein